MNRKLICRVINSLLFVTLFAFFNCGIIHAANNASKFYVAPDGSDRNKGTEEKPFLKLS